MPQNRRGRPGDRERQTQQAGRLLFASTLTAILSRSSACLCCQDPHETHLPVATSSACLCDVVLCKRSYYLCRVRGVLLVTMGNTQAVEQGSCGYRVLGVQPNSPASKVGLVSFFDFIVAADGESSWLAEGVLQTVESPSSNCAEQSWCSALCRTPE